LRAGQFVEIGPITDSFIAEADPSFSAALIMVAAPSKIPIWD
jgi:hypothetical protein